MDGTKPHEYAHDLIDKMKVLGLRLCTTEMLFEEVVKHAIWAIRTFKDANFDSPSLLQAASGGPGYKQNLFIDGFVSWANQQGSPSLKGYFRACLGEEYEGNTRECIEKQILEHSIEVIGFSDLPGFQQSYFCDRQEIQEKIRELRIQRGSFSRDEQCQAEAEVLILCKSKKATFLSQSGILDSINHNEQRITWKPESLYRFLSSFSTALPSEDRNRAINRNL